MAAFGSLVGVALLGFLAGLFSLRVKSRWCPRCGESTLAGYPGHPGHGHPGHGHPGRPGERPE